MQRLSARNLDGALKPKAVAGPAALGRALGVVLHAQVGSVCAHHVGSRLGKALYMGGMNRGEGRGRVSQQALRVPWWVAGVRASQSLLGHLS
jgi:hypothetical protein